MKQGYKNIAVIGGGYFAMKKAGFKGCATGWKSKGKK